MTDAQTFRVESEWRAASAHLAQKSDRFGATEFEDDDKPSTPTVLQPRPDQILEHMARLFDKIA